MLLKPFLFSWFPQYYTCLIFRLSFWPLPFSLVFFFLYQPLNVLGVILGSPSFLYFYSYPRWSHDLHSFKNPYICCWLPGLARPALSSDSKTSVSNCSVTSPTGCFTGTWSLIFPKLSFDVFLKRWSSQKSSPISLNESILACFHFSESAALCLSLECPLSLLIRWLAPSHFSSLKAYHADRPSSSSLHFYHSSMCTTAIALSQCEITYLSVFLFMACCPRLNHKLSEDREHVSFIPVYYEPSKLPDI